MNLLLYNALIFTNDENNTILRDHAIAVTGNVISDIGPVNKLKSEYASFDHIDGNGRLLMPGFINTHMHFYGTFARGLALKKAPQNFHQILKELWWKLDSALDLDSVYYSTLVPAISAVRHGVTTIIDHHASPNAVSGSLERIEEALATLGLRAVLCYEISDRDGDDINQQGLHENARYIQKCSDARQLDHSHLYDAMVGLHASFTLNDNSLRSAADLSNLKNSGCHIHVLEDFVDQQITQQNYNNKVVQRLLDFGILGSKSIPAHGIYLEKQDIEQLAETGTMIVHNPQSNMNNAVGRTDIFDLLNNGVTVGLGTDGMSASIFPDTRTANLLHKHDLKNSNAGWTEIQKMLLKNNPEIYQRITGKKIGRIAKDYLADMILLDYYPPTPINNENFWGHFLFGIADAQVDTTIINGKMVMHQKEIKELDETAIAAKSSECAEKVWKKFSQ